MNNLNLEKHFHEANEYINELSQQLGHPGEEQRVMMIWRAVMHSIRDRIPMAESLHLISQLPLILKGLYVDQWTYDRTPPKTYETVEEMTRSVEALQARYGEEEFDWNLSTEEIISITINSLRKYASDGQLDHIKSQMPGEVKELIG